MAASSAAHLASNVIDKPSIFELVASSSLDSTFHPALKKIAKVTRMNLFTFSNIYFSIVLQYLATINPERFQKLIKYYDEIFFVLNAVIQNYYLRKNGELRN